MNKKDVQQQVLRRGKPLALDKFRWDEDTNTLSTTEHNLVIDFGGKTDCIFKTGADCTFKTGSDCTFDTGADCTFKTGSNCIFKTGRSCTFKTGSDCTFDTGADCTFKTGSYCTFKTGSDCTFDTGSECVIIRRYEFEVIQPEKGDKIELCPFEIPGYLRNGMKDGIPHIIADGILSKIIQKRGDIYRVINYGEDTESWLVKDGNNYAHGSTLKEAQESIAYKISDRDKSEFEGLTPDDTISFGNAIAMYRSITGACEYGVRSFVENEGVERRDYKLSEIIEITEGQYGHDKFKSFIQ